MRYLAWLGMGIAIFLVGCNKAPDSPTETTSDIKIEQPVEPELPVVDFSDAANAFQSAAQQQLASVIEQCAAMKSAIDVFMDNPTEDSMSVSQLAFGECYGAWVSASVYFQQPFSLSEESSFQTLTQLIDTRPFLPGYIDGIPDYPFSGLVHDLDVSINESNIRGQHRLLDEESASVGFPVIEFFLWKLPVADYWIETNSQTNLAERRLDYLKVASTLLMDNLSTAALRWQRSDDFAQLPNRAQQTLVLQSIQRLLVNDLLSDKFIDAALIEPEWHHSAIISGNGRHYLEAKLNSISQLLGTQDQPTAFRLWLDAFEGAPIKTAQLEASLNDAREAIEQLPVNYPFDTQADETWLAAQQAVATSADQVNQLLDYLQVPSTVR